MMRVLFLCALLVSNSLPAAEWQFGDAVPVAVSDKPNVFFHMDSAGRRNMAVSDEYVAIVWESNISGAPQVYIAFRHMTAEGFMEPVMVSDGKAAFEPVLTHMGNNRFVVGWEQDGEVRLSFTEPGSDILTPLISSQYTAAQVTLASKGDRIVAAWKEQTGKGNSIRFAQHRTVRGRLKAGKHGTVTSTGPGIRVGYPSVVMTESGRTVVAWEDRRKGHNVIMYSSAGADMVFQPDQNLNEIIRKSEAFGEAQGVARVTLAATGDQRVVAVWLDKRSFRTGYEVFAAYSHDEGRSFGSNQKVQDDFGNSIPQWHATLAADAGVVVVAWDDTRDESSDIWWSVSGPDGWSDDTALAHGSGAGQHTSPALAFDKLGNLHAAWVFSSSADSSVAKKKRHSGIYFTTGTRHSNFH